MEYLDIVNEKDEVIGKEERNKAHENHLLHRAIVILISNDKDEILLQLRKSTKKQYPLFWASSVGAHVTSGENPMHCALREMKEEIGINAGIEYVGKFKVINDIEHEIVYVFFGKSNGPFKPDYGECEKIEFFSVDNLKKNIDNLKMTPHLEKSLQMVFKKYY
jgi:isopentenyl-diphosphate Delta-isomerase